MLASQTTTLRSLREAFCRFLAPHKLCLHVVSLRLWLDRIFMVCVLVSVSACLVRPSTSTPQIAGIADDVAALLSKLGAKSTDEAVAKLWAKGDELSKAEQDDLIKLLKSSDGLVAIEALLMPVKSKLEKLNSMVKEYGRAGMPYSLKMQVAPKLEEALAEVNAAAARYRKIQLALEDSHTIPSLLCGANKVLAMSEIQGLGMLSPHFKVVGNPHEVVKANVFLRKFDDLQSFIFNSISMYQTDKLFAFNKVLKEGNLESEVYPVYNSLLKSTNQSYDTYTEEIVAKISRLHPTSISSDDLARELLRIENAVKLLRQGLQAQTKLLEGARITTARAEVIKIGSLSYLKGAGIDGSEMMTGITISDWSISSLSFLDNKLDDLAKKFALSPEVFQTRQTIEMLFKEIAQMP